MAISLARESRAGDASLYRADKTSHNLDLTGRDVKPPRPANLSSFKNVKVQECAAAACKSKGFWAIWHAAAAR